MDWQAFADGMRQLVSARCRIVLEDVIWLNEPLGMLGRPCAFLSMAGAADQTGSPDEVLLHSNGSGADATVQVRGNRAIAVTTRVLTRDQTPNGRAYVYLERLRNALYWPSTQAAFDKLCVSLAEPGPLVELGRSFDFRAESEAALELSFLYTYDTHCGCCGNDGAPTETVGTIEHVIVDGLVWPPFNTDPSVIAVPPRQIDRS
jgi:hypothetical protein